MRYIWRGLAAIMVVIVLLIAVVLMIPAERIARLAADQFEKATGRAMRIEGEISPRFWPVLGIKTGPVTIANAPWSVTEGPMFTAESMTIEVNASALFGGDIKVLGLNSQRPRILLERSKSGEANWEFTPAGSTAASPAAATDAAAPASGGLTRFTLERGLIEGGTFRYIDHASGQDLTFDNLNAELAIPDFTGPFTLQASGVSHGQKVTLALQGGLFQAFAEGRVSPLSLTMATGAAQVNFEGRGGWNPMAAEGVLQADLGDLAALGAAAGVQISPPPEGFGARKLTVNGQVVLDAKGAAYLRDAKIEADNNVILGDMDFSPGAARPKLSGNLRASTLDLRGLSGESAGEERPGGSGGGMQAAGWPKERIDVSALGLMDANLSLAVGAVDLGLVKFGQTQLMLTIDRARAVFDLRELAAYGGAIRGEFVVNGRGGLSVGGNLVLAGLDSGPLMMDLAGWDRLTTRAGMTLKFLGVGNSIDEIMQSLQGDGTLTLGKGEIRGLDIAGMLRNLDISYVGEGQRTVFDGIAGTFTIADGNLTTSDLRLVAPYVTADGAGRIGLGARDLDLRLRPTAFPGTDSSGAATGGVMVPLRITGPWADLKYRLDLETIAREKMEAEAKAAAERLRLQAKEAEDRAKADLEAKLKSELGVEAGANESLEDAAKRRAREAVSKEAGRLLEGLLGGN
ncbi:AsmA family protein [Xinfangfangia sp. D13-10-4-6]|uniref:AsmA family protein n=1 Tax=Pseudogemmobacter hezensis TaxID=2737662 RepID=UPI001552B1E4|nr:AsmA family protein [Pseudogemmobacter hezensis]NPD13898.1 AsmA family protein [Pseudogemmobacter hezensis]